MIEIRDTSVPIVVLQLTPWTLHHGGLGIARTAGRLGVRVYWAHAHRQFSPVALSRYVCGRRFCDACAPAETLVEHLLEWGRQIGSEPILIPVDDRAAIFVADQAEALRERFLFPKQPVGLTRALSSKKEMHYLCRNMGVPTPAAAFPQSKDDVATFVETAVFPVVLKRILDWPPEHWMQRESVTIVSTPEELLEEYENSETLGKPNLMLQEYIPGGPEDVWMFNGFFTDSSDCLIGFTGKKIRQRPPFTGATTLGICLHNHTVRRMATEFLQRIGYRGIVDMGFRYDRRDGQYKLLDVNPRVGSTFRLFVDSNGVDVVRALYLHLTGQPVKRGSFCEGRKWIVEPSDLLTSLRYCRMGKLTPIGWMRSFRGIEEGAWFAADDPLPFAVMCCTSLVKSVYKLRGRTKAACVARLGRELP
jgi:predicted ATP-grasp superfamily ATP-dependent carboligase